jgi:structural maintenance of chromosome 3 (chondroitin sulfate proteoglycan 6)
MERRVESEASATSIQELIDSLDVQKDEAILRTFQGVSEHFAHVFQELVPAGEGELVMLTRSSLLPSQQQQEEEGEEQSPSSSFLEGLPLSSLTLEQGEEMPSMDQFIGVGVRVRFPGTAQLVDMASLSGGQKVVVALSLIFAIQRCDPLFFYLFDEIDQALDETYRSHVAELIRR